jgi:oligopeptide transport system ATP-binding protein
MPNQLLEVKNLETQFSTPDGTVHAVNGISFSLKEGETLGVVGESGCGKSVTMMSLLRLIPMPPGKIVNGEVLFQGQDLMKMTKDEIRHIRGAKISMIFQDPMTSLNPVLTIGKQMIEPLQLHLGMTNEQAQERAAELLTMVGISDAKAHLKDYPHQFSGGMRQRVMIAMSLACNPEILIADEPTTALDVTIQAQIADLVKRLRDELGMAVIWITHDLGVVAGFAERVLVMYAGFIVENAPVIELYENPQHPYTTALLRSLPRVDGSSIGHKLEIIEGLPPALLEKPVGCPFAPRCKFVQDKCYKENPALEERTPEHYVACWVDMSTGELR